MNPNSRPSSRKNMAPPISIRGKNSQEIQYYEQILNRELMTDDRSLGKFSRNMDKNRPPSNHRSSWSRRNKTGSERKSNEGDIKQSNALHTSRTPADKDDAQMHRVFSFADPTMIVN